MNDNNSTQPLDLEVRRTSRGFEIIEFKDFNDQPCSLQQSSLAIYRDTGVSAIWFGVSSNRMHLTFEQVKSLLPYLQRWVDDGIFLEQPKTEQK